MPVPKPSPPESSLFRKEVFDAKERQVYGVTRLMQPVSSWVIVAIAALLAISLSALLVFGVIPRKALATGLVVPINGSISVNSPATGTISRAIVQDGAEVSIGQPLYEVSTERRGNAGELSQIMAVQLKARAAALGLEQRYRVEQEEERKQSLKRRLQSLSAETAQLDQEIGLATHRQKLAQQTVLKFQTLQTSGYVSEAQTQQKTDELLDSTARLATLGRAKQQLYARQLEMESELRSVSTTVQANGAQFAQALAALEQEIAENAGHRSTVVVSPQSGILSASYVVSGQAVNSGQALANILPAGSRPGKTPLLEIQLFLPSRSVGFVAPGQSVRLRYSAFPYQKFGLQEGVVTEVSRTPLAPSELPPNMATTILSGTQQLNGSPSESLYRVRVLPAKQSITVYGREQTIKPGMTVEADIVKERLKLWEMIFEPVLAVARR